MDQSASDRRGGHLQVGLDRVLAMAGRSAGRRHGVRRPVPLPSAVPGRCGRPPGRRGRTSGLADPRQPQRRSAASRHLACNVLRERGADPSVHGTQRLFRVGSRAHAAAALGPNRRRGDCSVRRDRVLVTAQRGWLRAFHRYDHGSEVSHLDRSRTQETPSWSLAPAGSSSRV
jgi:hypothetical protein